MITMKLVRLKGKYRGMYELRPRQERIGIDGRLTHGEVVNRYSKLAARHLSKVHGIEMVDTYSPLKPQKKTLYLRRRKTAGVRPFP